MPDRGERPGQDARVGGEQLRVVLAEDNLLLREGLQTVLERAGFEVAAAMGTAGGLLDAAGRCGPDLVVTDIRMPPHFRCEGLEAAVRLRRDNPGVPVVILSQYVEQSYVGELLADNDGRGVGYLLKDRVADVDEFVETLHRVRGGGTAVDPAVVTQLIARRRDPLDRLTPREREVLAAMAEGHSNATIARRLVVSEAAVVKHVGNVLAKLDLPPDDERHRRVAAVLTYLRGPAR